MTMDERIAQRRQQFLRAGTEVFGTVGYRAATVRTICREANLTDRYFYETFGSLETLVIAVYELHMSRLSQQVIKAIAEQWPDSDAEGAMRAGLEVYFTTLTDRRIARICMIELEGISARADEVYNRYIQTFAEILIALAARAFPVERISPEVREVLGISLIGALRQSTTHWLMSSYRHDAETMVEGTTLLFRGVISLLNSTPLK